MTVQAEGTGAQASRWLAIPVAAALFAFPATLFASPRIANAAFSVLAAAGLLLLARDALAGNVRLRAMLHGCWQVALAMAGLPLAVVAHRLFAEGRIPDLSYLHLRFLLFLPLVWILIVTAGRSERALHWGFATGVILSAVWLSTIDLESRPDHVGATNMIPFANLSLLMGLMALASVVRNAPAALPMTVGLIAGLAGLYVSIASGTRGGWIAIPILLIIAVPELRTSVRRAVLGAIVLPLAGLAIVIALSERLRDRVVTAIAGLRQFEFSGTADEPVGIRLELWRAAIGIFRDQPLAGIGPEGFGAALLEFRDKGLIGETAAGYAHAHSDLLHALATLGTPGLAGVAASCLVPAWFFAIRIRSADPGIRLPATVGLTQCCGMLLFGLTETMFVITLTNAFHTLVVAGCLAAVLVREHTPG